MAMCTQTGSRERRGAKRKPEAPSLLSSALGELSLPTKLRISQPSYLSANYNWLNARGRIETGRSDSVVDMNASGQ